MLILIIDDQPSTYAGLTIYVPDATLVFATTPSQATTELSSGNTFDFILIDGCIASGEYDTKVFIDGAKEHQPNAILISTASSGEIRKQMVMDGCSLQLEKISVGGYLRSQMQTAAV